MWLKIKTLINNPNIAEKSRILAALLLNFGILSQAYRMWDTQSSADQSLLGWFTIDLALLLAYNYYRVVTPALRLPQYTALTTLSVNIFSTLMVIYLRIFPSIVKLF